MNRYLLLLLSTSLLTACAKKIPEKGFPGTIIPSANQYHFRVGTAQDSIRVLYLGCGHLIIRYRQEAVMIDPFFSTHGFTSSKIFSDTAVFHQYQSVLRQHQVNLSHLSSVWLAHTHYDHMSDLPLLLKEGVVPQQAAIYGSDFGAPILQNFLSSGQYHALTKTEVYDPKHPAAVANIAASPSISILPIRSSHAPHYKLLGIPIHLMKGKLNVHYFKKNFTKATDTTQRKRWKEGCTYSYLVDFKTGSHIDYRLFVQTSASDYPLGRPPIEWLRERPVDVAFLCAASSNYVKKYPAKILNDLYPTPHQHAANMVWIHWEDFFGEPLAFKNARLVRLTNFKGLGRRLRKAGFPPDSTHQVMPRPGTMITIR
jgi:hypothetical protein